MEIASVRFSSTSIFHAVVFLINIPLNLGLTIFREGVRVCSLLPDRVLLYVLFIFAAFSLDIAVFLE